MSSGGAGVAKTVSFSPLRPEKTTIKITLDAPYQLKWPHIASENVECLLEELKKSLSGVKELLSSKFRQSSSSDSKKNRRKRARKRKSRKEQSEAEAGGSSEKKDEEPPAKKICQETSTSADNAHLTVKSEAIQPAIDESAAISSRTAPQSLQDITGKRAQLVVGTNAVTRCLEEGSLRVGVVCLTAKPALLHRHMLQLAATRRVPMAAIPNLSPTIAPLLGMKSSLAIGIKKVGESEVDCYRELVDMVTRLAPPISVPWLTSDLKVAGDSQTKAYLELNVKKTITKPKRKNK